MGSAVTPDLSKGGEIDGDLTITGDFKVEGAGSFAYDEIIQGTIGATRVNIGTRDASGNPPTDNASYMLQIEKYGGTANIKLSRTGNASSEWSNIHNEATIGTITEHPFVLQTHSTDRLTITSAGLVGIGATPSYNLDIQNAGLTEAQIKASSSGRARLRIDANSDIPEIYFSVSGTRKSSIFQSANGNNLGIFGFTNQNTILSADLANDRIGIGTESPATHLHVNGNIRYNEWQTSNGNAIVYVNGTDSILKIYKSNGSDFSRIHSNGTSYLMGGNVGIGTTSPNTNLEVVGTIRASGATPAIQLKETDATNAIQGFQINSSGGSISFNSLNNNDGFTSTDYQMHRTGSGAYYHKWFIANSSRMILNNSGNLGIGTDSPSQKLDIYGSMVIDDWIRGWEVPSNHTYGRYWMNFNGGHPLYRTGADDKYHKFQRYSDEDVMVVGGTNKRVGIGTSSPQTQLHLNSTSPDIRIQVSSGTNFGSLQFYNNSGALASAIGNYGHTQNLYFQVQGANNALFHSAGNIFYKDIEIENQFPNITFDDSQGGVMKIGSNSGDIRIFQNASGDSATTETIYVTNTGKVGIGNSSSNQPTAKLEVTPNDSDLTSNSALGLWIKGSNGGIKIGRHDGNDGAFTHIYTDVASTDFAYIVTNDRTGGGIATDRVAGADNNPSNNYIELKSYAQTHSILGTTVFKLDQNSRISLSNNDSGSDGNTLFGKSAGNSIASGAYYNSSFGNLALQDTSTGDRNTAVGSQALYRNATGGNNTAVGAESMLGVNGNSHSNNTAIGAYSLNAITTGGDNVALGANSLDALTSGTRNTALGYNSATALGAGETGNIAIGWNSMSTMDEGSGGTINYNIALGVQALSGADLGSGTEDISHNIAIGTDSLRLVSGDASTGQIAIGRQALSALTSGSRTTAVGYQAGLTATTIDYTTIVGYQAGLKLLDSTHNTLVGYTAGYSLGSDEADSNTFMGTSAGANGDYSTTNNNTANNNVGIGKSSMGGSQGSGSSYNFTATNNVAIGVDSLKVITTANNSTAVGYGALQSLTAGNSNLAIGYESSKTLSGGAANITLGHQAMLNATNISSAIFIGANAGDAITTSTNPNGTIGIGYNSLTALTTGAGNTALGYQAGQGILTGHSNTFLGYEAGSSFDSGESNMTAIGRNAMSSANNDSSSNCVAIGVNALEGGTGVITNNIAIGKDSMSSTSNRNVNASIAIGQGAMDSTAGGEITDCIAIGRDSMHHASNQLNGVTGSIGIGAYSLQSLTTGNDNIALGYQSGDTLTTGTENTIIGSKCDVASADNTNNVIIGNNLTATDKDNAVFIGNDTNHIENDFNADATWNYSSDERQKKDIKDDTLGLEFINDLRPVTYKHKSPSEFPKEWSAYNANDKEPMGGNKTIHGLIAQEVKQALDNQGVDTFSGWSVGDDGRQRISAEKMVMPLIKAVQELSAEVKQLKEQLKDK